MTKYQVWMVVTAVVIAAIIVFTRGAARWGWLTAACTLAGTVAGLGVSFPGWQFFGESFCGANTREKCVALTFDDGPDEANTPALLALLAERGVRATFFLIGSRVAGQPELARRIAAAGHAVENHTQRHSVLTNLFGEARLRAELAATQTEIQRATGCAPKFFRPPAGLTNPRVFRVARQAGLQVAGYTARGLDRRPDSAEKIAGRLLTRLRPGAIFLLHDAGVPRERLLAVVTLVLDQLQAAGYACVRLDELKNKHDANLQPPVD